MTMSRKLHCPECSKKFRTKSGLQWHLYHRHGWKDMQDLLEAPPASTLAKEDMMKELELAVFAKEANVEVAYLKQLIEEHFGKDAKLTCPPKIGPGKMLELD